MKNYIHCDHECITDRRITVSYTHLFAFTGNKFEFRMVGSSDSIASANTVLNTIIAEAFKEAADKLEKADNFDMAVHDMIKETLAAHKRVVLDVYKRQGILCIRQIQTDQ